MKLGDDGEEEEAEQGKYNFRVQNYMYSKAKNSLGLYESEL